MATTEIVPAEAQVNPQATENINYDQSDVAVVRYRKTIKDEQGNETVEVTLKMLSVEQAKEEEKSAKGEIVFTQTVGQPKALNYEGVKQLSPDEEEAVAMFNRGNKIKVDNKLRAELTAQDENGEPTFAPVEGVYDLTRFSREKTQARGLTPAERILKAMEKELAKIKNEDDVVTFAGILNMPKELVLKSWHEARA